MLEKVPDTGFQKELIDINREFLSLMTDPTIAAVPELLGLPAPALEGLRKLSTAQLDAVAETPILLAEFAPLPGQAEFGSVADAPPLPASLPEVWQREAEGFANRLLACIWQAARQEKLLTAFCIGIDMARHRRLAGLSFRAMSQTSEQTLRCLRVRLASHPSFWSDMVRLSRDGNETQRMASRLAMIPLTITSAGLPTTTSDRPRYF